MNTNTMRTFKLFALFFLLPITFHAQKTLTGLWTGALTNDSTTARKDQSFEIALTQYKEKVYGYSRSTFIVDDTLYYIMKRVKGTINGDVCEVKDDEIISYNFPGKIDKGVKVTTTFRMNREDSTWRLSGNWSTNQSRRRGLYAVSGKIDLQDEPDIEKSKIFPHLEELDIAKEVPFYVETKKAIAAKEQEAKAIAIKKQEPVVKKEEVITPPRETAAVRTAPAKTETVTIEKPATEKKIQAIETKVPEQKAQPVALAKPIEEKKTVPQPTVSARAAEMVAVKTETKKQNPPPAIVIAEPKKIETPVTTKPLETVSIKPEPKKQEPVAIAKPVEEKKAIIEETKIAEPKKQEQLTIVSIVPKKVDVPVLLNPPVIVPNAAIAVKERKTTAPQEVTFKSDSIQLALYDNGEIDGDTVSVLLNGELILAKQGLKASALRKTIYVAPDQDEITLVLYAENLGKYAPNTGLLVVYDGEERYQVRFSADLTQNASVIFRRKK